MQQNFLRLLQLGENSFLEMVEQVAQLSEDQAALWQARVQELPVHLWIGDAHDAEAQTFLKAFKALNIPYTEHQCTGFDAVALSEAAEKHTEASVHVACGFGHTQMDVLSSATQNGAWLNGYGIKSAPWAALAEVALMQKFVQEHAGLDISNLRVCWIGKVNALGQSLMEAAIYTPFELFMGIPPHGDPEHYETGLALKAGAKIFMTREPELALDDAVLIYIDAELEQLALDASKEGKPLPSIPLGMETYPWQQGFCLSADFLARTKDTVYRLPTVMGAQVQEMAVLLQNTRQALRRHALLASLAALCDR